MKRKNIIARKKVKRNKPLIKDTQILNFYEEFKSMIKLGGFIRCGWDGDNDTEAAIKGDTKATIRCILADKIDKEKKCIYSGKPAKYKVIFARAY